ncbi:HGGxSTG domain-containing protein [Arhodomonas sp. KWT]|uniref:HGGxSTG domain-containing protein n=1 Tax=Arhodomonas sp. KWT TaxID=2679915 RepID=UPI0035301CB7
MLSRARTWESGMSDDERRRLWVQWHKARARWIRQCRENGAVPGPLPEMPPEIRGLRCGVTTKAGTPCRRRDLGAGGRCRLHGGRSTGPRSAEGRRRVTANLPKRAEVHQTP